MLNKAHIPYILTCHLQIDADSDPDFYFMRMRIEITKVMRIRIHNIAYESVAQV